MLRSSFLSLFVITSSRECHLGLALGGMMEKTRDKQDQGGRGRRNKTVVSQKLTKQMKSQTRCSRRLGCFNRVQFTCCLAVTAGGTTLGIICGNSSFQTQKTKHMHGMVGCFSRWPESVTHNTTQHTNTQNRGIDVNTPNMHSLA